MNELFRAFSESYVKALDASEKNNLALARKHYLQMLLFHERIQTRDSKSHLLEITHQNLTSIFKLLEAHF